MANWIRRDEQSVVIGYVSALRWAVGLSICAALVVPVVFEWLQPPRARSYHWNANLWRALLVLGATTVLSPWTRLRIDRARRTIDWRRQSFARSWVRMPLDAVESITAAARPNLWLLARYVIRLRGRGWSINVPVGWSVLRSTRARTEALAQQLNCLVGEESPGVLDGAAMNQQPARGGRLSLRRLLIATALCGAMLGLARLTDWRSPDGQLVTTAMAAAVVPAFVVLFRIGEAATERFLVSLVAMYGPFLWIVSHNRPWGHTSGLYEWMMLLPGLILGLLLSAGGRNDVVELGIGCGFALVALGVAAWMAFRGPRASAIFSVAIGLWSTVMSFFAYALYRA